VLGNWISVVTDFNDYLYYNTTPSVCNFRDKAMSVAPSKSAAACFSLLNIEVSTGTSTSTPTGPIGHDLTLTTGTDSTNSSPTSIISSTNKPPAGHVLFSKPFLFMARVWGFMYLVLVVIGGGAFVL
jgi:hypothetical protein